MKILHINSYFSVSKFYKNLYDKQIKSGLNIDVFVPVSSAFKDFEAEFGTYTTLSSNHAKYDRFVFHLKHHKIYKDIVGKYDIGTYSIIHAHSLFSNGHIAMRLKKQFGIPYIVAVRNTDVNTFFKKMIHLRKMGLEILKNSEHIVFLSKSYRDEVIQKYVPENLKEIIFNKSSIIPNGIDDFWLENRGNIRGLPNKNNLKLLYVGVINKNKNIISTCKAIEVLQAKGINAELTIVGRIDDSAIYNQIKNFDFVRYIEPKPKEVLLGIYRRNDIFVMPSFHETFGLVYPEAMSQGLPVIYTRGQGFDGQFEEEEEEVGFAVDCTCANDIAKSITRVANNYQNISINCIRQCNKFNWLIIEKEYNDIYVNSLVNSL